MKAGTNNCKQAHDKGDLTELLMHMHLLFKLNINHNKLPGFIANFKVGSVGLNLFKYTLQLLTNTA